MKKQCVLIDDLELSDVSVYKDAFYLGKLFTGTAISDEGGAYEEWTFVNGNGHGRWFSVYENGQLQEETILDEGEEISSKIWTKEGILIEDFQANPFQRIQYYTSGEMKYIENQNGRTKYYPSGTVREKYIYAEGVSTLYAEDGTWLVRHKSDGNKPGARYLVMSEKYLEFNDEFWQNHYLELLKKDLKPVMFDFESDTFYSYFIRWMPQKKREQIENIILNMIASDELVIKYDGINLARGYKVQKAIPAIDKEKLNHHTPEMHGSVGYAWTIGQLAEKALQELYRDSF